MNPTTRRLIFGSLLAMFLVADLWIGLALPRLGNDWLSGIILGLIFAQATLIAIWIAWGNWPAIVRMSSGLLLIALLTIAVLGMAFRDTSRTEAVAIGIAVPTQWLVVLVPFWLLRLCFGWRVSRLAADQLTANQPTVSHNESQFGIGQLLLWMVLVSVVLAVARAALPDNMMRGGGIDMRQALTIIALLFVFNSLLAWPLVWGTLGVRRLVVGLPLALSGGVFLSLCELSMFRMVMPGGSGGILMVINASQFAFAGGSLLVVRLCGYRLRRGRNSPVADEGELLP